MLRTFKSLACPPHATLAIIRPPPNNCDSTEQIYGSDGGTIISTTRATPESRTRGMRKPEGGTSMQMFRGTYCRH